MDRILQSFIDNYKKDFNIEIPNDSTVFEYFANYCVISKHLPEAYRNDVQMHEVVHTGAGGDYGIDGIAIYIDEDKYISDLEQAKEVIGNQPFSATFIFVQAKTSASFDAGEMMKTGAGVCSICNGNVSKGNKQIKKYSEIISYIYSKALNFKKEPECFVYYVTTGKWTDDDYLCQTIENIKNNIKSLNMFSRVEFIPRDCDRLQVTYKEISNTITKKINVAKCLPFPKIRDVEQAFLGLVSIQDYLSLITDSEGKLQNSLFYDNVRGFLGNNPVNNDIRKTLENSDRNVQFPILNNGVTIVTKSLKHIGEEFEMSDFQIVNGCQTSNVIYKYGKNIKTNIYLPVKIICTENSEVINDVIKSTNRQTEVKIEAFESLKPFHKKLQNYYDTFKDKKRLYYERRPREYSIYNGVAVPSYLIITLASQLLSVVSMFLDEPQSTHRYYGELLAAKKDKVFLDNHVPCAYYTSAWTLFNIDQVIRKKKLPEKIKHYRYQLLMVYKYIVCGKEILRLNSHATERACNKIMEDIKKTDEFVSHLKSAESIIMKTEAQMIEAGHDKDMLNRMKEFTLALKKNLGI